MNKQTDVVSAFGDVGGGDLINRSANRTHYLLMETKALTGRKRVSRWSKEKIYRPETGRRCCLAKRQGYNARQREPHAPRVGRAQFSRKQRQGYSQRERAEGQQGAQSPVLRNLGFVSFLNDNRKPLRVLS